MGLVCYIAQVGIWSPRDKEYVWKDFGTFDTKPKATVAVKTCKAWRVLSVSVVAVKADPPQEANVAHRHGS